MIKTSLEILPLQKIKPVNDPEVFNTPIPPTERIRNFSPDQFEEFILEWAISCVKTIYKDVYRIGGAGDMGRDVIAEYDDGEYDYYQCKRYEDKLVPSKYWIEFGKLCYYTYAGMIPVPKKYYIIASQGLGPSMLKLIKDPISIRKGLIENWDEKCKKKISEGKSIELDDGLLNYINNFDFKIVDTYSINKIIEEHRQTDYFYFRFGGIKKPQRNIIKKVPEEIEKEEHIYIQKILKAYSENKSNKIDLNNISSYPNFLRDFSRHRSYFYSAESLRYCVRDIFVNEDEFEKLKKEMYSGIIDFVEDDFEDGYVRLKKTMHEATKVNLSISILDRDLHFVSNDDKKGLCHHIANNNDGLDQIEWSM